MRSGWTTLLIAKLASSLSSNKIMTGRESMHRAIISLRMQQLVGVAAPDTYSKWKGKAMSWPVDHTL